MSVRQLLASRRTVLVGLIGLAGTAVGVDIGVREWRRLKRPSVADLERFLLAIVGDRNLDPEAIPQFAREYVRRYGALSMAVREKETLGGLWDIAAIQPLFPSARTVTLIEDERRMVSLFLRSTDYFRRSAGERARYVAFANPYETTCSNPFATFDL